MRRKHSGNIISYTPKSTAEIRAIALDLRTKLGIYDQHAPDLAHLLNKIREFYPNFKLKIVSDSALPRADAKAYSKSFTLKIREEVLELLRTYGYSRSRFTVGHELGHLILQHPGNQPRQRAGQKNNGAKALLEQEANIFASELLMPSHLFDPQMTAAEIGRRFQVSTRAAEIRKSQHEMEYGKPRRANLPSTEVASRAIVPVGRSANCAPAIFVSMRYSSEMNRLYAEIIKPSIEAAGLRCVRADEISSVGLITTDIESAINNSAGVVAEITGVNPNVMHEIGLAQSQKRPIVLVCRQVDKEDEIPSNIRGIRRIMYSNDAAGGAELRRQLDATVKQIFATDFARSEPV